MISVIEYLKISFGSSTHEPITIVKGLLSGKNAEDDRRFALAHWWSIIDEKGIRNFESREALIARLAVCILAPKEEEISNLGEQLSWFLEVLGFLGADVDKAIVLMEKQFSFT